jgi:cell division protein FtsI/penicillin-binding protein 2
MKHDNFIRYWLLGAGVVLFGLVIFLWVVRVEASPQAIVLKDEGDLNKHSVRTVYPERGNIYDRWGFLLAGNVQVYEIDADVYKIADKGTIATTLASILGLDYNKLMAAMSPDPKDMRPVRHYVVLARFVTPEKIDQIQKISEQLALQASQKTTGLFHRSSKDSASLDGLEYTPMLMRSYPENSLAANILGFYSYQEGESAKGNYGIEAKYDDILGGKPFIFVQDNDPQQVKNPPLVPAGASLVLTIDRDIQAMTERVLDKAIKDTGSKGGTILIMDPKTGEMLSMAVQPRMDLNKYWEMGNIYPDGTPFDRSIGTTYEPGSVFKVLTMAAAFDAKVVNPDTPFLDTGTFMIGGVAIHDWDRGAWGPQTMLTCMQHSLNVCLAWVASQLGPTRFYTYMNNFGIGHRTLVDLDGESNYPLHIPGDPNWYEVNLGTNAFGQGVAVTPIQMITAINSVANHGNMMAPHLVHSIIQDGEERPYPPQVIGRPISTEAADTLSAMLATSLEKESSAALVDGYKVSGKTGTAEIPGPDGYSSAVTNASFVGWGPTDDPRFIVYIWLEKPATSIWGSVVASPVFKEIVENLVILMDIPPDDVRHAVAQTP